MTDAVALFKQAYQSRSTATPTKPKVSYSEQAKESGFLTGSQASEILGIHKGSLNRLANDGKISYETFGGKTLKFYSPDAVESYKKSRKAPKPPVSEYNAALGSTIRNFRKSLRMPLRQLAEVSGVSVSYLSSIERGNKECSSFMLSCVVGALDVSLSTVLRSTADLLDEGK